MLWGCEESSTRPFDDGATSNFNGTLLPDRSVVAFHEPEIAGQANCSPERAADVWVRYIEPLRSRGYRLGSPATTTTQEGREWMMDWYAACAGKCHPDFIAVHWYDTSLESLRLALEDRHAAFGLPVWLTEFAVQNWTEGAVQPSQGDITRIMLDAMEWLDETEWVEVSCLDLLMAALLLVRADVRAALPKSAQLAA